MADVFDPGDLAAEPVDLASHRRAAEVERAAAGGADDEDDPRVRVVAERVGEQALGLLALRGGVGEARRLEVVLDVFADRDREDGERADGPEDELRVLPGEVGDADEHSGRDRTRFQSGCFEIQINAATIGQMGRREYGQPCSLACALDQIGERWSLLIVRELMLGPLRFSELARAVGGAPTDVLTKRLRDLEEARGRAEGRARAAGLGDRLRADRPGARPGAAAARAGALGAQLPRSGDGRRDAARDAAQRPLRDPAPAARRRS